MVPETVYILSSHSGYLKIRKIGQRSLYLSGCLEKLSMGQESAFTIEMAKDCPLQSKFVELKNVQLSKITSFAAPREKAKISRNKGYAEALQAASPVPAPLHSSPLIKWVTK